MYDYTIAINRINVDRSLELCDFCVSFYWYRVSTGFLSLCLLLFFCTFFRSLRCVAVGETHSNTSSCDRTCMYVKVIKITISESENFQIYWCDCSVDIIMFRDELENEKTEENKWDVSSQCLNGRSMANELNVCFALEECTALATHTIYCFAYNCIVSRHVENGRRIGEKRCLWLNFVIVFWPKTWCNFNL